MANLRQVRIIHEHFAKMKELMQIKGSFVQTEAKMNKISRTISDQKNKKEMVLNYSTWQNKKD